MSTHQPLSADGPNRLTATLARRRAAGQKSLVTFVTAGDPALDATVPLLHALVDAGADVLELGVPFSDPEAEGPAIQAASERALANGTTLKRCLAMVRDFRDRNDQTPVVLMGYLNSVLRMGSRVFAEAARDAGVDGLILVNLPPEEAQELRRDLAQVAIELVFLVAPTTTSERRAQIVAQSGGFVYYVSLKGTTGAGHINPTQVAAEVAAIKQISELPVMVGFGIKDGRSAAAIGAAADGVVVGSALVSLQGNEQLSVEQRCEAAAELTRELRAALDADEVRAAG
ncbi:MAG: tryptophan synthase subunit alpha [Pseudomonadota bacterium]